METRIISQITNAYNDIKAIADGYQTKISHDLWLVDGLQKDSIQNSWDARIDKKSANNWECGFYIKKINDKKILCIVDKGTTGLNGTRFKTQEEVANILNGSKNNEELAYFLNSNWSAKIGSEGGNRGRGKTLFLISSQESKIFFDSLRSSDGTYIFGELFLDKDKQIKYRLFYDDLGKQSFEKFADGHISNLDQTGTRIFVVSPDLIIEKAIRDGSMSSLIKNTWWEILKKNEAKIFIDDGKEKKYILLPSEYEERVGSPIKNKELLNEVIKEGTPYKIKRLVMRHVPENTVIDSIKGIAIQRGGMTIERLLANELIFEEGLNNVYGWVEMAETLEREIKIKCEGPEHFDFVWNLNPARYLKDYLKLKLREFAKEFKIIQSEEVQKNKIQRIAEKEVLTKVAPFFKKIGLSGKLKGKGSKTAHRRREDEPLRLSISTIKFPNDNRRVNYGEKIEGAVVVPINNFSENISVLIRIAIIPDEGDMDLMMEKKLILNPGTGPEVGPGVIEISEDKYGKIGYTIKASMISLEEKDWLLPDGTKVEKGTILYNRINQKFYVESDPPQSGPFHLQGEKNDKKDYLFRWEPEEDCGYIIYYNESHPRIKPILYDVEKLINYLSEQISLVALQIKLEELIANNEKDDKDFGIIIKSKDIGGILPIVFKKYSEFLWDLFK